MTEPTAPTTLPDDPLKTEEAETEAEAKLNEKVKKNLKFDFAKEEIQARRPISLKMLTSLSPKTYGSIYLLLLPTFGLLYTLLPNIHFNHPHMTIWDNMYFSAVTITTLGYGDITPLDTNTRLLAMVEAILGVIFVGLFLNSVSYSRQEETNQKLEQIDAKKELVLAFSRLRSHDSLIVLNMNSYLNRVNQLLGVENLPQHISKTPATAKAKNNEKIQARSTGLWGIYEPMPAPFAFADLKNLFQSSSRLTDDPNKPQIWYYYQALDDLIVSIENLLREADLYRWEKIEMLCTNFLIDVKAYNSSSYILAQPDFERQLAQIIEQREHDMVLIGNQPDPVELAMDNDLNPYIILYMGIKITLSFIKDFQEQYQEIMQSI